MPDSATIIVGLGVFAAGAAALLTANLATARHINLSRRTKLVAEVRRRRREHHERVERELAAFDAEFDDVDIEFLSEMGA